MKSLMHSAWRLIRGLYILAHVVSCSPLPTDANWRICGFTAAHLDSVVGQMKLTKKASFEIWNRWREKSAAETSMSLNNI